MRDIAEELSSRSKKQGLERQIDEVKDEYNKLQTLIQTKEKVETTYVNDWTFFFFWCILKCSYEKCLSRLYYMLRCFLSVHVWTNLANFHWYHIDD